MGSNLDQADGRGPCHELLRNFSDELAVLVVPQALRACNMSCHQANGIQAIGHDGLYSLQLFRVDGSMYRHQLSLQDGSVAGSWARHPILLFEGHDR